MTTLTQTPCALCGKTPSALSEPPCRTLDRGPDPDDDSYSITVLLPDVPLCDEHTQGVREGEVILGWCDDNRCRAYGPAGDSSKCGAPYGRLASGTGSRPSRKRH